MRTFATIRPSYPRSRVSAASAVAFLLALSTLAFIEALVNSLILPVVAVIFDHPDIVFLSFAIGITEFRYGALIAATIVFAVVAAAIFLLSVLNVAQQERRGMSAEIRACPECASAISLLAKRCPHCTAPVPSA